MTEMILETLPYKIKQEAKQRIETTNQSEE